MGERIGKREYSSIWQLQFMNHRGWTQAVYPVMEMVAEGI
jgi:hypothetical protein